MARDLQTALLFPGQGSQTADMRDTVERARPDLLELALEEVGPDVFERAPDGTRWAQPAIYCAALAGAEELDVEPGVMAGHSLGEITALVAAGAIGAEDGAAANVAIANDNAPDQLVLSGSLDALDRAEAELRERGIRGKRLPVAGEIGRASCRERV